MVSTTSTPTSRPMPADDVGAAGDADVAIAGV
jgi:hypothetical protein